MTPEERLAAIVTALEEAGLTCLVMGGHAVRYYGLDRNTIDFDLHLSPDHWDDLPARLGRSPLFASDPPIEGPSWRPHAFRRFQIGRLPDGREEWLEFWRNNHLLPPFADLHARREEGRYGGLVLPFLSLPDLIRSKETERNTDWQDIAVLEEILDARQLTQAIAGQRDMVAVLSQLRSRRGFERLLQLGYLADSVLVRRALEQASHSVTQAFLLPFAPDFDHLLAPSVPMESVVLDRLRTVEPGSGLHLTLVEAVRRQYKQAMQGVDRTDKEAIRASQANRNT